MADCGYTDMSVPTARCSRYSSQDNPIPVDLPTTGHYLAAFPALCSNAVSDCAY